MLQVIAILLRKFRMTSNPRKFALFEQNKETESESPCLCLHMCVCVCVCV